MIAGSFSEVGGGQADKIIRNTDCAARGIAQSAQSFANSDLWVSENRSNIEPKTRDGVRNRSNVARLIGGSINGAASLVSPVNAYAPGNIGLVYDFYSATRAKIPGTWNWSEQRRTWTRGSQLCGAAGTGPERCGLRV